MTPEDARRADENENEHDVHRGVRSYTRTLWYAIRETKRVGWVKRSGAAADTDQWSEWLTEARDAARLGERNWNAVGRKDAIMREWEAKQEPSSPIQTNRQSIDRANRMGPDDADDIDEALQHAPAEAVQLPASAHPQQSTW